MVTAIDYSEFKRLVLNSVHQATANWDNPDRLEIHIRKNAVLLKYHRSWELKYVFKKMGEPDR